MVVLEAVSLSSRLDSFKEEDEGVFPSPSDMLVAYPPLKRNYLEIYVVDGVVMTSKDNVEDSRAHQVGLHILHGFLRRDLIIIS